MLQDASQWKVMLHNDFSDSKSMSQIFDVNQSDIVFSTVLEHLLAILQNTHSELFKKAGDMTLCHKLPLGLFIICAKSKDSGKTATILKC